MSRALADPRVTGGGPASSRDAGIRLVGPSGCGLDVDDETGTWEPGGSAALAGRLAGLAIEQAVSLALSGAVAGVVTAPIDKSALLAGGFDFPGHTEMLAHLTGSRVAMMLASTEEPSEGRFPLRVVLATTHMALRDVPDSVTVESLVQTAGITREHLQRWFEIPNPRIALCALNPHAGDGGRFGTEDDAVLAPAARVAGIAGPLPADTVFVRAMRGEFDAVIAPYHDVGMTAIKVASFGRAVNVTLGLPFPRTSPDHGTALDIAGRGIADAASLVQSILLCRRIAALAPPRGDRPGNADPLPATRSAGPRSPSP